MRLLGAFIAGIAMYFVALEEAAPAIGLIVGVFAYYLNLQHDRITELTNKISTLNIEFDSRIDKLKFQLAQIDNPDAEPTLASILKKAIDEAE